MSQQDIRIPQILISTIFQINLDDMVVIDSHISQMLLKQFE